MAVTRVANFFRPDDGGGDGGGGGGGDGDSGDDNNSTAVPRRESRALNCIDNYRQSGGSPSSCLMHRHTDITLPAVKTTRAGLICTLALVIFQLVGAFGMSTGKEGDIKVQVKMPREAEVGSSVELNCEWRLLGENTLYSVKWYKDEHEFFQYVPDRNPRIQTFMQPGVHLDKKLNSENSIRLTDLILESSGQYKCEVSTEAPSFAVMHQTANLTVIALPERGPEITGLSSHYAVGENVTANCTAWPSVPKANLRWTINGEAVPPENTVQHPPLQSMNFMGIPNSLGLRLEAEPRHFERGGGFVRIKCIAEVGSRVFEAEKTVLMAYVNNQRLSAGDLRSGASSDRYLPFAALFLSLLALIAT